MKRADRSLSGACAPSKSTASSTPEGAPTAAVDNAAYLAEQAVMTLVSIRELAIKADNFAIQSLAEKAGYLVEQATIALGRKAVFCGGHIDDWLGIAETNLESDKAAGGAA